MNLKDTLAEREESHGKYSDTAAMAQSIKHAIRTADKYYKLRHSQRESLDLIASKIARILSGNPDHVDSWHDIAGYALLIERELSQ